MRIVKRHAIIEVEHAIELSEIAVEGADLQKTKQ
jgi:hypothetical protein